MIEAIRILTYSKDSPYFDYIKEIKNNKLATIVKIEDLKHNSDLTRLNQITIEDKKRIEKYEKALILLESS